MLFCIRAVSHGLFLYSDVSIILDFRGMRLQQTTCTVCGHDESPDRWMDCLLELW